MTRLNIVRILLQSAHNIERRVLHLALDDSKGTQEGEDVLDRHDTHHRADRDRPAVVDERGNVRKPFHVNPVRDNVDLLRRTAEISGDLSVVLEQGVEVIRRIVREACQIVEVLNPDPLEIRLCPVALDDLRLTLTRVDPMLRDHIRLVVDCRRHRPDHTAVARRDAVVHIRLGQFLLEQVEQRQEHRAHRPEKIRKWKIVVLLTIDAHNDIEEVARHKDFERRLPSSAAKNLRQIFQRHIPPFTDELIEGLRLLPRENVLAHIRGTQGENLIQKCFLDPDAVLGQLVLELTAILCLRTDRVDDELMLGQPRHEHLNPRGHAAHNIWVAALRQETDPHSSASFQ